MCRQILYNKGYRLAAALSIGLLLAVFCCCLQASAQQRLSDKLLRLHVVANSDSEWDQALKLKVRDAVLECEVSLKPTTEELRHVKEAADVVLKENRCSLPVKVTCERMYFETRTYPEFALPAGYYRALRVVIGEGQGQNWWCVVYPALCSDLAEGEAELTEDEMAFIQKDGKKFLIRFKVQELISALANEIF